MTNEYIKAKDLVEIGKKYAKMSYGFTKWSAHVQTGDATYDFDGRYVVSVDKIADIRIIDDKNIIIWHKAQDKEMTNIYFGGWYNTKTNLYEIEVVNIVSDIDNAFYLAEQYKQKYIYDLKEEKLINVDQYFTLRQLKWELKNADNILLQLQKSYINSMNYVEITLFKSSYNKLMKVRKRIARRISLLESQGDV